MTDQTPSPALSDDELRETLDMVGTVLASVSNRVDEQTKVLDRVNKTATEARQAAFAARSQTDPEHYGELVGKTIDGKINDNLIRMGQMCIDLFEATHRAQATLKKAEEDKWEILEKVRERERKAERLKRNLPWFGLGAVALALAMTVTLPRVSAINGATCAVFGGQWLTVTSGGYACVQYQD